MTDKLYNWISKHFSRARYRYELLILDCGGMTNKMKKMREVTETLLTVDYRMFSFDLEHR